MTGRSNSHRARWLGLGLVLAATAVTALGGGSASGAVVGPAAIGGARIAAARDASAAPGITLAGFTTQQLPSFFKVTGDGRTLSVGAIALGMTCTSGSSFVVQDAFARVRISPTGTLRARFSTPPTAAANGATVSGTDALTARLSRRHTQLSGTWRMVFNYSASNGMSDRCDSGPVRFVATS